MSPIKIVPLPISIAPQNNKESFKIEYSLERVIKNSQDVLLQAAKAT